MKSNRFIFFIIILVILSWNSQGLSLVEKTHQAINEHIAQNIVNSFSLNTYLKNNLGFNAGKDEILVGVDAKGISSKKRAFEWIGYGGEQEDRPGSKIDYLLGKPTRSVNHFHNPLRSWDQAGLNDMVFGINFTGQSQVLWAQNPNQYPGGKWSWQNAREYFYIALTGKDFSGTQVAINQADREKYFANTFRAVGQLMHLVEDSSVAMHARNDIHVLYSYEGFVEYIRNSESNTFNNWVSNPISFDKSVLSLLQNPLAPIPIARIIDTDKYDGTNPDITRGLSIGISEYTNANFLSEDTIFIADFPYPDWSSVVEYDDVDATGKVRTYLRKLGYAEGGYGEHVEHLAVGRWFYKYFPSNLKNKGLKLDDRCYSDYASLLIPRAVGYSAGLLDYFFRGTLEITPPDQVAYAVTDGSQTPYVDNYGNYHQQFTSIKTKVRNSTPDTIPGEEVQNCNQLQENCILHAVARYKIIPNYQNNLSNYPPDGTTMQNIEYSYSVSEPKYIDSLSSTTPQEFTFYFTNNPIPAGITDLHLFIVFKGTLGNETDIAIAVGMKDLMEPTHQVLWNLTDMFSLDNHLYTSDTIKTTPALADRVDFDDDGIFNETNIGEPYIDPYAMTFGVGYLSAPGPNPFTYSAITVVQPGRHIRLVVLVDKSQNNYLVLEESNVISGTSYFYFASPGVINQEVEGIWQPPTPITTFRYGLDGITQIPIRQHYYNGVLRCYPTGGTDPYGNPVCYYPESESIPAQLSPSPIDTVYFP